MKKLLRVLVAVSVLAAIGLAVGNFRPMPAGATSTTGMTVGNPLAQSASPTVTDLTLTGNLSVAGTSTLTGAVTATGAMTFPYGPTLTKGTTNQVQAAANPIGTLYLIQERVAGSLVSNAYNLGVATATAAASCVYVAISTSAQAAAGAACVN